MLVIEGVAFAVGLLLVAGAVYFMTVEALRKERRSH